MVEPVEVQRIVVHGHERAFVKMGKGPALLLLHGLACDHTTWTPLIRELAKNYTVIAPDLLGHGQSDKPRADYSIGGYANGMRDLLTVLNIDKVTVVGHSLGGGVAMQFGYQFPERTERMIVIAPGGFGLEVTPAIRMVTVPGFVQAMGVLTLPGVRHLGKAGLRALAGSGLANSYDLNEVADIYEEMRDARFRRAIHHVVRQCIDFKGQIITMSDRAYLTKEMPTLVIWGTDDKVIPASHAAAAARLAPGAVVEILPNSGHFPHKDHPERVAELMHEFVSSTRPATYNRRRMRQMLLTGNTAPVTPDEGVNRTLSSVQLVNER
jgi:pimeloyl-ACP methyl ester carboxylesterase